MFTDIDVATVIRTLGHDNRPGHAYTSAMAEGMPDATYSAAITYAHDAGLVRRLGQMIEPTRKGKAYVRQVGPGSQSTREITRDERTAVRAGQFAVTSDDFDGPLARTPGSSSSSSGATL